MLDSLGLLFVSCEATLQTPLSVCLFVLSQILMDVIGPLNYDTEKNKGIRFMMFDEIQ